jgi:cytochrome P450
LTETGHDDERGRASVSGPREGEILATTPLEVEFTALLAGDPEAHRDPYRLYAELRERAPVYAHGAYTVVSRYADVRDVYMDNARFKKNYFAQGTYASEVRARVPPELASLYQEVDDFEGLFISRVDDEAHARLRRIAHRAFTPRMIAGMEEYIRSCTIDLLDRAAEHDEVDLTEAFAYRLPLLAIAQMLGVPASDVPLIHRWSSIMGAFEGRTNMAALRPWHEALAEFRGYVQELVSTFRHAPPDTNLITALLDARGGEHMSQEELLAAFVVLLFAGHETTTNLITNGIVALMRHRDQWERLCATPELVESAVEELLRYDAPVQYTPRLPAVDVEVGGVPVAAGQALLMLIGSANRDTEMFDEPDVLDIARGGNRHLSLLLGGRFCLGASLARLEGRVAFGELARRHPRMQLVAEPTWNCNPMLRGVSRLVVALGGER